jgi:hypothetical protein
LQKVVRLRTTITKLSSKIHPDMTPVSLSAGHKKAPAGAGAFSFLIPRQTWIHLSQSPHTHPSDQVPPYRLRQ